MGWIQDPETGRGLFVEHDGQGEEEVRGLIAASLRDLQSNRGMAFGPIRTCIRGAMCTGAPTCALVIGSSGTTSWESSTHDVDQPAREPLCV